MSQHDSQLIFSFLCPRKTVTARFDGGEITTDAGLLALKEFEHKIGYLDQINTAIEDLRQPAKVIHEQRTLLAQRLFGIVAGYEDCNDHQRLRHDPTFKVIAQPHDMQSPLSSQPTLCRLENRITSSDLAQINQMLIDTYLNSNTGPTTSRSVILDLDTTDDACHGKQQLCLFNAHYDNFVYLPLLIFEGQSGHLLSARLRIGQKPSGEEIVDQLQGVVDRLRASGQRLRLRLRADAEFAAPDLYTYLEDANIAYAIGVPGWEPLQQKADRLLQKAKRRYEKTRRPQKHFGSFMYKAKSWNCRRRIVIKVEVSARGTNMRFVITNMRSSPHTVFAFYEGRGECENRIKELKNGFCADRLSCHLFVTNSFRLLLHALAYNLHHLFRLALHHTPLAKAQIDTMRSKLFKIGAHVQITSRRIWFRLSSSWPDANIFRTVCRVIAKLAPT